MSRQLGSIIRYGMIVSASLLISATQGGLDKLHCGTTACHLVTEYCVEVSNTCRPCAKSCARDVTRSELEQQACDSNCEVYYYFEDAKQHAATAAVNASLAVQHGSFAGDSPLPDCDVATALYLIIGVLIVIDLALTLYIICRRKLLACVASFFKKTAAERKVEDGVLSLTNDAEVSDNVGGIQATDPGFDQLFATAGVEGQNPPPIKFLTQDTGYSHDALASTDNPSDVTNIQRDVSVAEFNRDTGYASLQQSSSQSMPRQPIHEPASLPFLERSTGMSREQSRSNAAARYKAERKSSASELVGFVKSENGETERKGDCDELESGFRH